MDDEEPIERNKYKIFYGCLCVLESIGVLCIFFVIIWMVMFHDGFTFGATANPKVFFNWHPVFMTIGMIFLNGNSILVYRSCRYLRKSQLKIIHATIFGLMFIFVLLGSYAAFQSHNLNVPPIPNLYSLHSIVGLTAIILIMLQWIAGFLAFLYPSVKPIYKEWLMPYHIFCGLSAFALSLMAGLLGITEKIMFSLKEKYAELPAEAKLANLLGICFVAFGGLVIFSVTRTHYKRKPLPEDAMLLTGNED